MKIADQNKYILYDDNGRYFVSEITEYKETSVHLIDKWCLDEGFLDTKMGWEAYYKSHLQIFTFEKSIKDIITKFPEYFI